MMACAAAPAAPAARSRGLPGFRRPLREPLRFGAFGGRSFGGFGGGFGGGQAAGPARGDDLAVEVELTLEEAAFGVEKEITFTGTDRLCLLRGRRHHRPLFGQDLLRVSAAAARCAPSGRTMLGQFVQTGLCLAVLRTGQVIETPCAECGGAGRRIAERKVTVQIPAGIDTGQRIRVSAAGAGPESGGRDPATCTCAVGVEPHELFERHDDDILYQVDLTMVQAALGATITVPTLDGDEEVSFAAGTQPGDVKVLRGKGVQHLNGHGRGDQADPRASDRASRSRRGAAATCSRSSTSAVGAEHYAERPEGVLHKLRSFFPADEPGPRPASSASSRGCDRAPSGPSR